ncbi:MAG: hypothetical protein K2L34_00375 [Muribaculaceae bacterium]|nr:hypothetical protein [Muribaculaceae bacterium]
MDFRSALSKACNDFGKEIIFEKRIISILADYGAFKNNPAYKVIYKLFLSELSLKDYIDCRDAERQKLLMKQFVENTGINEHKAVQLRAIILDTLSVEDNSLGSVIEINALQNETQESVPKRSVECNQCEDSPEYTSTSKTVKFLGITLGSPLDVFVDELKKRSAKIVPGSASKTFKIQSFLSYQNVKIELYTYETSPVVKNIVVTVPNHRNSRGETDKIYNDIQGLYVEKYSPYDKKSSSWQIGFCQVEVKLQRFWEDGIWGSVKIRYTYSNPELINLDLIERHEQEIALLAEKQKKREEERLIKMQKEEQERIRKQKIREQSLNDI